MRSILLPLPSPVLHREAFTTLVAQPAFWGTERAASSILELGRNSPSTVGAYYSDWRPVNRVRNIAYELIDSRYGGHNQQYQADDALTMILRNMELIARPILQVDTSAWVTNRAGIKSWVTDTLAEFEYPDYESVADELAYANRWISGGAYIGNMSVRGLSYFAPDNYQRTLAYVDSGKRFFRAIQRKDFR